MRKKYFTIIILLWTCSLLIGCAGSRFIPEGSQILDIYDGSFDGVRYGGTIRVHLFQTSGGDKQFRATISTEPSEPAVPRALFVGGKMAANSLEGEFQGNASGTFNGQLSSDGNQLTGSFNITSPGINEGTWQAKKNDICISIVVVNG